jgi:predicted DNA-binding transcriptional regulator AlpA
MAKPASTTTAAPQTALEPLRVDARAASAMLGVGRTLWLNLVASGRAPRPVRLGRRVLWVREELIKWVRNKCPRQEAKR